MSPPVSKAARRALDALKDCLRHADLPGAQDAVTAMLDNIGRLPWAKQRAEAVNSVQQQLLGLVGQLAPEALPAYNQAMTDFRRTSPSERLGRYPLQLHFESLARIGVDAVEVNTPTGHSRQALLNKIARQPERSVTLSEAAAYMYVSESYFSRSFKQAVGTTFVDWQMNRRLQRAKLLLAHTTTAIHEISENLGFVRTGYFCRVFRARTGMSPRAFRQAAMMAGPASA
jgi:AraC-like DNA-binding protein